MNEFSVCDELDLDVKRGWLLPRLTQECHASRAHHPIPQTSTQTAHIAFITIKTSRIASGLADLAQYPTLKHTHSPNAQASLMLMPP